MQQSADLLDELMICRLDAGRKTIEPCSMVIFGATGDLTARKLVPALYQLFINQQLPSPVRIVGFARREKTSEVWREELKTALNQFSRTQPIESQQWQDFSSRLFYCLGDINEPQSYQNLAEMLAGFGEAPLRNNLLFYLATQPSQFGPVVQHLSQAGLFKKGETTDFRQRLVVEKPFGHDLQSAQDLNAELTQFASEKQILRIDHFLGKETVQNILVFRFSNSILEKLWNRDCIDHVQITVSEDKTVGSRGGYYEEAGALRDMVQNHLLQIMALISMEPPFALESEAIRDEKVKLLQSIRPITPEGMARQVVRGQYKAGQVGKQKRGAYREESKVSPDSNVETFVALKLFVDNWRWSGVPFYLRTGKNLPINASEVRVQFRPTPHVLFAAQCGSKLDANSLTLRLQPDEGINLLFNGKIPGPNLKIRPVRMQFSYHTEFGAYTPEAYERLLLEALAGDPTLFLRRDEVEAAWTIVDPIRESWNTQPLSETEFYPAGTWGPKAADDLLALNGHAWRHPQVLG